MFTPRYLLNKSCFLDALASPKTMFKINWLIHVLEVLSSIVWYCFWLPQQCHTLLSKTKTKCTSSPSIRTDFWLVIFIMAVSKDATNSAKYDFDVFCKCWACLLVAKSFIFVKWDNRFLENCIVYLIKRKIQPKRVLVQGQYEN